MLQMLLQSMLLQSLCYYGNRRDNTPFDFLGDFRMNYSTVLGGDPDKHIQYL